MSKNVIRKKLATTGGMPCLTLSKDLIGDLDTQRFSTVEISKAKDGKRLIIDFIENKPKKADLRTISIPIINLKLAPDFDNSELAFLIKMGKILQDSGIEYPIDVIGKTGCLIKKTDMEEISRGLKSGLEKNLFNSEMIEKINKLLLKLDY